MGKYKKNRVDDRRVLIDTTEDIVDHEHGNIANHDRVLTHLDIKRHSVQILVDDFSDVIQKLSHVYEQPPCNNGEISYREPKEVS